MRMGAMGQMLVVICLSVTGCSDDSRAGRSSWDARSAAPAPEQTASAPPVITWDQQRPERRQVDLPSVAARRGPLPIGRPIPPQTFPTERTAPLAAPTTLGTPIRATAMCPTYGNEAAAILTEQMFPIESARMTGGYQVSDGGTMVSFWDETPLVVLGLQGQPVYCVAERAEGQYRIPAGRRICFADPDGDFLFDRVFIVQAEPKSYETAPVHYELNPMEARRRPSAACYVPG